MTITFPQAARQLRPGTTRRRLAATEQELEALRGELLAALGAAEQTKMNTARIEAIAEGMVLAFRHAGTPVPEVLEDIDRTHPNLRVVH